MEIYGNCGFSALTEIKEAIVFGDQWLKNNDVVKNDEYSSITSLQLISWDAH